MADALLQPVHNVSPAAPEQGSALCLSGGGYRAMLFHAGCLWRLNQLGLLADLKRISSVSGGSIIAAVLGMNWNQLGFKSGTESAKFEELVVEPIRQMARTTIDEGAILGGLFLSGSVSDHIANSYDDHLFHGKTLQDLPDQPQFVINATNVQSGVLMRFSKAFIRDYRVGQILNPALPLARAVAASSAFPPLLSPCELNVADHGLHFEPRDQFEDLNFAPYNTNVVLTDGGVYDNLGLESAWKHYDTILVSDGGGHLAAEPNPHHDWARHSYRILNIIDNQVRALRVRQVIELFKRGDRQGCYWGIRQGIATYFDHYPLDCPFERTMALAEISTRLARLDDLVQERLINWGYAICDASLRRFFSEDFGEPASFPYNATGL